MDLGRDGRCRSVWRSPEIAPSVVPKVSLETGLVYTYTKPPRDDGTDAWYFTALDFCTGRTVYSQLAGIGLGYNNNFAPVTLGAGRRRVRGHDRRPVRLADATPPSGPPSTDPARLPAARPRAEPAAALPKRPIAHGRPLRRPPRPRVAARRGRRQRGATWRFYRGRPPGGAATGGGPFAKVVDARTGARAAADPARVRMDDGTLLRLRRSTAAVPRP